MKILVTGSTGYIGSYLCKVLESQFHEVFRLSRRKSSDANTFYWNISQELISQEAIENADAIIHLAGENIGASRWTAQRKDAILQSRQQGTRLLVEAISRAKSKPKVLISASATGYYGAVSSDIIFTEDMPAAQDFLGSTTAQWEQEALKAQNLGVRTVLLRTGVVLSSQSKALQKMKMPILWGVGSDLGSGKQYLPWIHLYDLVRLYLFALDQDISGVFNAVAPEDVSQHQLNSKLAKKYHRPLIMPRIPEFLLKIALGEMAVLVTQGSRVSSAKIQNAGFDFKIKTIDEALNDPL